MLDTHWIHEKLLGPLIGHILLTTCPPNSQHPAPNLPNEEEEPKRRRIRYEELRSRNRESYEVIMDQKAEAAIKPTAEKLPKEEGKSMSQLQVAGPTIFIPSKRHRTAFCLPERRYSCVTRCRTDRAHELHNNVKQTFLWLEYSNIAIGQRSCSL